MKQLQLQPKLLRELSSLRKGRGLTPSKLQGKTTLRSLAAHATATSIDSLTDSQVYNFLLLELSKVPHSNAVAAFKNALGVGSSEKRLLLRRTHLARRLAKHPDTIERYENEGMGAVAGHLAERNLLLQVKDTESISSPLHMQELEAQAKAARAMTVVGLSSHLSLAGHSDDLLKYLESPRKPYINANIHIGLLPSSRGPEWYCFRLAYTFQGGRESFRVAVVLDPADGEQLMASGLVDDFHRLDNPHAPGRDIKTIIASSKFTIRNQQANTQRLLRLHELQAEEAQRILESVSRPLLDQCWLLEVTIPPQWQTEDCSYEYLSTLHLQIASVAYWYSPALMYLKKLTLDFSQFPEADNREFFILPFFGHAPGTVQNEKHLYVLDLDGWIMPGHGIVLGWQDKNND